ncbi:MAG: thiol-disulfide oxidoreductase DCC family protein [Fimbriimonadaceae bacterium]
MEKPTLLYDGDCGFCQWSVDNLRKRDHQNIFDYIAAHAYPNITDQLQKQSLREVILIQENKTYGGADAALRLYCQLKPWSLLQIFRIPPFLWPARGVYRLIANNRLTISRWLKLPTACSVRSHSLPPGDG